LIANVSLLTICQSLNSLLTLSHNLFWTHLSYNDESSLISNAKKRQKRPNHRQNLLDLLKILRRELSRSKKSRDIDQPPCLHLVSNPVVDYADILRYQMESFGIKGQPRYDIVTPAEQCSHGLSCETAIVDSLELVPHPRSGRTKRQRSSNSHETFLRGWYRFCASL